MKFDLHPSFPEHLHHGWNALLDESINHVPFLRYEYLREWWQTRGGGEWPQEAQLVIVSAHQGERLVGIAPLFWAPDEKGSGRLLLLGSIEISDYLDLIVRPADLAAFSAGLISFLLSAEIPPWGSLDLYNLLDSSPSLAALAAAAQARGLGYRQEMLQHSPYIPLPGDWETYLAGIDKKQRHEIRRKMRRAEASEVPVHWTITSDPAALEGDINAFLGLMAQDPEKAAFLSAPMRRTLSGIMRCAFEAGCLQLAFLEVGGEKAAAYLSFDYLGRVWVYNSGLDRRFMDLSPGWVLLGYLLQWANQNGRTEFDFMRGDEDYKYRFGAIDRRVVRAVLTR